MEFSFKIGDTEYKVPDKLNVWTFQLAISWDLTNDQNYKPFISAITGCPLPELDKIDDFVLSIIFKACTDRIPTNKDRVHQIESYTLLDTDKVTFGDFIDLDILYADGIGKHVVEAAAKLYGTTTEVAAEFPIDDVWPTIVWFFDWRKSVYRDYEEFFETQQNGRSTDDDEKFTINSLQLMWYEAVLVLAGGEFLKINQVVDRPMREALNFLTWKKAQIQKDKLEQVKRKYDLQRSTR